MKAIAVAICLALIVPTVGYCEDGVPENVVVGLCITTAGALMLNSHPNIAPLVVVFGAVIFMGDLLGDKQNEKT